MIECRVWDHAAKQFAVFAPVVGDWYTFVELPVDAAAPWHYGAGEIAQYVGDGEFYEDGSDDAVNSGNYDFAVFSHQGKAA